jgi:hypothetical protein
MKIIQTLLVALSTFLFFYLLGCFYNTTFNIELWEESSRSLICFLGGLFSPLCGGLCYVKDKL